MPSKPKSDEKSVKREPNKKNSQPIQKEEFMDHQDDFNHDEDSIGNSVAPGQSAFQPPMANIGSHADLDDSGSMSSLNLEVSKSLRKRLELSARDEGISVADLASELLAEGLVLRAWEIVERKSAMRGGGSPQQQHQQQQRQGNVRHGGGHGGGHQGNKQGGGHQGNKHGGGRMNKRHAAHAASLNLMEDKAAFLEYVRNQERKNHNR